MGKKEKKTDEDLPFLAQDMYKHNYVQKWTLFVASVLIPSATLLRSGTCFWEAFFSWYPLEVVLRVRLSVAWEKAGEILV